MKIQHHFPCRPTANALLPSLLLALVGMVSTPAHADLAGFGTNGTGYTLNQGQLVGGLSVSNNVATLTNGIGGEGNSLFNNTQQNISAFNVSFTYQDVGANGSANTADGFTFTLQNDTMRGASAVGGTGNSLGYLGAGGIITHAVISPSVAVGFNVYSTSSTFLYTNGTKGTATNTPLAVLYSGNPINVSLRYNPANTTLTETLTDSVTPANTSTFTYNVNIANILGSSAYVGFTGATGSATSTQTISNFSFTTVPEPSTWAGGFGVVGLLGLGVRRRLLGA